MPTIITKNSSTASSVPTAAQLLQGELAVNVTDRRLFTENASGTVVELGTNPSSLTLPNGTANGVAYLNGSKVLTTGSALTFDGTNFGIGTSSPAAPLDVVANSSSFGISLRGRSADNIGTLGFYTNNGVTNDAQIQMRPSDNELRFLVGGARSQTFYTNGSEQMRLTSTGLGIGTSSPSTKLHVAGSAETFRISGGGTGVQYQTFNTTGGNYYLGVSSSTGTGLLGGAGAYSLCLVTESARNIHFGTNNTLQATIDTSGNLGLGVTPSAWASGFRAFEMPNGVATMAHSSSSIRYDMANVYFDGSFRYKASTGAVMQVSDGTNRQFTWNIAPSGTAGNAITFTQAMTLDSSGNLLVGGTTGTGARIYSRGGADLLFADATGSNTGYVYRTATNSAQAAYFITSAGQAGYIQCTGNTTSYVSGSDYRLKDNVRPLANALDKVAALRPVAFEWKSDGKYGESFLAHELAEVCPQAVTGEKDAVDKDGKPVYQGIDTSFLVATLTAAIQEQQAIINAQSAALEQLKADVAALKGA